MGGFIAIANWGSPVAIADIDAMLETTSHRVSVADRRMDFQHATLAETPFAPGIERQPRVSVAGHLAIVGDLRLWNRDGLRNRAGGHKVTAGIGDRHLLLEAYRRTGVTFLDDVDGDFAFVIWDDRERRAIAVRDRFGMKPLFFDRTSSGIRFASEPKQLVATSSRPVRPCLRSVAEYIDGHFQETRLTFFEGIERVRPATALIVGPSGEAELRYWNPTEIPLVPTGTDGVANGFRAVLTDSVRRRLATSKGGAVSHLSGGLDSSSIAAAAHLLSERDQLPSPFHTVSAVFPGHSIDESAWINQIVQQQPFSHDDIVPEICGIESFDQDMWIADQPRVGRIRELWTGTAAVGSRVGADLVFTGIGGDQVLDQYQLLIDRLRSGPPLQRLKDAHAYSEWSEQDLVKTFNLVVRDSVPQGVKRRVRNIISRRSQTSGSLIRHEVRQHLATEPIDRAPYEFGYPSLTQDGVVGSTQHPSVAWINEAQAAVFASRGIDLSQPYLDRTVVEYVASIPVHERPYDGRSKTLVRSGFSDWLPASVLDRRSKTIADDYLDVLLEHHGAQYRERYPTVSSQAKPYLDSDRYRTLMGQASAGGLDTNTRETLWSAWTLMAWLDGLPRYGKAVQ